MSDQPNTQLATLQPQQPRKASHELASFLGMEPKTMLDVIAGQCFKGGQCTDLQLAAFVSIAAEMKINPMLPGMLYAYPIQGGGIIPMIGPDGVYKKLVENPDIESWESKVYPEDPTVPPTHAIASIYRKGREKPLTYTAVLSEWKVDSNPNWKTRPRHMLGLRALKHCARQIIHGLPYDEDDRVIMREAIATEIPKAQLTDTKAVDAEILPPEKKAEKPKATEKPKAEKPAEPKAEPKREPAPPQQQSLLTAETPMADALSTKLEEEKFAVGEVCAMAKAMNLTKSLVTTLAELGERNIADILGDWDTAKDFMASNRK